MALLVSQVQLIPSAGCERFPVRGMMSEANDEDISRKTTEPINKPKKIITSAQLDGVCTLCWSKAG